MTTDERVEWLTATLDHLYDLATRLDAAYRTRHDSDRGPAGTPFWPMPTTAARMTGYADPVLNEGLDLVRAFSPPAVIVRVEADRWTVGRHQPGTRIDDADEPWVKCTGHEWVEWPCDTFRNLLSAYRYMPEFKEEWLR